MSYLLDTCTFLWAVADKGQLSPKARQVLADKSQIRYLSVVSAWEISVKYSLGKLPLPKPPAEFIRRGRRAYRIRTLWLLERATVLEPSLPQLHKDPFDRMLICQAMDENLTILTPDQAIRQYPVQTDW